MNKEKLPSEKISEVAEKSLLKKLSDHMETVEKTTEIMRNENGEVLRIRELIKEKLVKSDLNAIIFALKNHMPEKWYSDEKELNKAKIAKLKAETNHIGDVEQMSFEEHFKKYFPS